MVQRYGEFFVKKGILKRDYEKDVKVSYEQLLIVIFMS